MIVGFVKYYFDKALGIKRPVVERPRIRRSIRKILRRLGYRPKYGSIFYSPAEVVYDPDVVEHLRRGLEHLKTERKAQS